MKKTVAKAVKKKTTEIESKPAPKKAVAEKKIAPQKPEKPVKAKASGVAPTVKAPKAKATQSSAVTTTIVAALDVGFGNHLAIRGEGPGLSWEKGVPMECIADDQWEITLPETAQPIVCKFLLNDVVWCVGEDYTVLPGASVVLSPKF